MERRIVSFLQDEVGDWVARLECFHRQHVRHAPPFRSAPWVLDGDARAQRIGTALDCPLCDRAELPDDLEVLRTTEVFDERTMPVGLRRAHRVPPGTWGRLRVDVGRLRFRARSDPLIDVVVDRSAPQAIPPGVEHDVEPIGPVRFHLELLRPRADGESTGPPPLRDDGGDHAEHA